MKVRVTVTLDVDPERWAWEYRLANVECGDTPAEQRDAVREDVKQWGESLLVTSLREAGLHMEVAA